MIGTRRAEYKERTQWVGRGACHICSEHGHWANSCNRRNASSPIQGSAGHRDIQFVGNLGNGEARPNALGRNSDSKDGLQTQTSVCTKVSEYSFPETNKEMNTQHTKDEHGTYIIRGRNSLPWERPLPCATLLKTRVSNGDFLAPQASDPQPRNRAKSKRASGSGYNPVEEKPRHFKPSRFKPWKRNLRHRYEEGICTKYEDQNNGPGQYGPDYLRLLPYEMS